MFITSPRCETRYDALVHNVVFADGEVQLDQVGGLDLIDGNYHWQWWRSTKTLPSPPLFDGREYFLSWYDHKTNRWQYVKSNLLFTSHTDWDPEVADREHFPESKRRTLK